MASITAAGWAAIVALASSAATAIIQHNNQPEQQQPPPPVIDKTGLQEEAELAKIDLGDDDEPRRRKRGKQGLVIELEREQEAARRDPGGVQLTDSAPQGVQLDTRDSGGALSGPSRNTGGGIQI